MYINNIYWRVLLVPPAHSMLQRADGSYTIGSCDEPTHTIYLSDMLKGYMLWKVLCHEITHAAMFSYNIQLNLDQEEMLADLIATYGSEIISMTNKIFNEISKWGNYN